ncbi:hypothetical protein V3C99_012095, partial [Haemonchus contortus]
TNVRTCEAMQRSDK